MDHEKVNDRLIVYVDGANLYHGLHAARGTDLLWLDLVKLAKILRPQSTLVLVKYFVSMVQGEPDAQSRQDKYLSALRAANPGNLSIIMGKNQKAKVWCKLCSGRFKTYNEKETDVNIAVHLLADVAKQRADTFMVITGDTDIIPALNMARALDKDINLIAQFPPRRESRALKRLLPSSRQITSATVEKAQLPDPLIKNGRRFDKPDKWKVEEVEEVEPEGVQPQCKHEFVAPSPSILAKKYNY